MPLSLVPILTLCSYREGKNGEPTVSYLLSSSGGTAINNLFALISLVLESICQEKIVTDYILLSLKKKPCNIQFDMLHELVID